MTPLTTKQAAERLNISKQTLNRIVGRGEIDSTVIGKRRMFLDYHIRDYEKKYEIINR